MRWFSIAVIGELLLMIDHCWLLFLVQMINWYSTMYSCLLINGWTNCASDHRVAKRVRLPAAWCCHRWWESLEIRKTHLQAGCFLRHDPQTKSSAVRFSIVKPLILGTSHRHQDYPHWEFWASMESTNQVAEIRVVSLTALGSDALGEPWTVPLYPYYGLGVAC